MAGDKLFDFGMSEQEMQNAFRILASPSPTPTKVTQTVKNAGNQMMISWFDWLKNQLRRRIPHTAQQEALKLPTPTVTPQDTQDLGL